MNTTTAQIKALVYRPTHDTDHLLAHSHVKMQEQIRVAVTHYACIRKVYYGEQAMGWTILGSNPGRDKRVLLPPKRLERPWGPPTLVLSKYQGYFPWPKLPALEI